MAAWLATASTVRDIAAADRLLARIAGSSQEARTPDLARLFLAAIAARSLWR